MNALEIMVYASAAGTIASALWHVAILVVLVLIAMRLKRPKSNM